MFGRPEVALSCSADTETAHVYVALCHVMSGAGGGYRLVTWGVANMNGGHPRPQTSLTQRSTFKHVVSYKSCMKPSRSKL